MRKELFIPISEANNLNLEKVNLRVNLPLPYSLDDKLEIDILRLHNLRQLGGFSSLNITRNNDSGISEAFPQIDGINGDGTAISNKVIIKTVPESSFENKNNKIVLYNRANWPESQIKLNIKEIEQRLSNSEENNINNEKLWANELDCVLKNTIIRSGAKHLLSIQSRGDYFDTAWSYLSPILFNLSHLTDIKNLPLLMVNFISTNIVFNVYGRFFLGAEKEGEGWRSSFTLGPEIERSIALNIYGRLGTIIKAKSEEIN